MSKATKYITIKTQDSILAFPLKMVLSVERVGYVNNTINNTIKPIPTFPHFVAGVVSYKGTIVPVINIEKLIFQRDYTTHLENKTVFLKHEGKLLAVVVDDVIEIVELPQNFQQPIKDSDMMILETENEYYLYPLFSKIEELDIFLTDFENNNSSPSKRTIWDELKNIK